MLLSFTHSNVFSEKSEITVCGTGNVSKKILIILVVIRIITLEFEQFPQKLELNDIIFIRLSWIKISVGTK